MSTTATPIRSLSTWLNHAKNAEVVLHRDAYKKNAAGTILTHSEQLLLVPELNDAVITEITNRIVGGAHFTFIKTGDSLPKAFPNKRLTHHVSIGRAIRALEFTTMSKMGAEIEKEYPDFMGTASLKYRMGLLTFEPKNPINPHSDFLEGNTISATACTQKLDPSESLSKTTLWNIDPNQGASLSPNDFTKDPVQGIYYLRNERLGDVESFELPQFKWNEGAIVFYSDKFLAHSASEQISVHHRRIHIVDLAPIPAAQLGKNNYSQSLRTARISFQDGHDIEF
mgnify:CR=1 FL=1